MSLNYYLDNYIMNINITLELISIIIIFIIFWYFNIRTPDVLSVNVPIETMKNISIFDGKI